MLPVAKIVLLPLPLFMRKPCPPLPGSITVSIDPTWPVTNAGPLGVKTGCPIDGDEPKNATGIAEAVPGAAAKAGTPAAANRAIAATATVLGMVRHSSARVLIMSVPFPEFELGSPDGGRFIRSGRRSDGDLAGLPTLQIVPRHPVFKVRPDTCGHAGLELRELDEMSRCPLMR